MSIEIQNAGLLPPENAADCDAVIGHIVSRKPLDPVVYRRVRERSERVTESIRRKHGILDAAVELIRATRDEE